MYDDKLAEAANHLSNDALENVKTWLTNDKYSAYRDEVLNLVDQKKWQQLEDSFFKILDCKLNDRNIRQKNRDDYIL